MSFTSKDMQRLGLQEISPGVWEKPKRIASAKIQAPRVKLGRSSNNELPVKDSFESGPGWCKIILEGLIPGLNGKDGLLREHWSKRKKRKAIMQLRLAALKPGKFKGMVKIDFVSFVSVLSDDDNNSSRRKILLDCMVNLGIIENDSPKFIVPSLPRQEKCRRKDQRTEIKIEKI